MDVRPYDVLTDTDKEMIKRYIESYATESGCYDFVMDENRLARILSPWNFSKTSLFHKFGDKLILERPIQIHASDEKIIASMTKEINRGAISFRYDWYNLVEDNPTLRPYRYFLMGLVVPYVLVHNKAENSEGYHFYNDFPCVLNFPNGTSLTINSGCKPVKMMGKIIKACVENYPNDTIVDTASAHFENFRLWHSQQLNTRVMTGTLCLSIHPLDFMTMSDNENDWHSCMSWINHGEYRQGTVEMMNSSCVVVAYLKSSSQHMYIAGHEWNSKKWRELFIINNALISEIKPYPYIESNLTREVIDWLTELAISAGMSFTTDTEIQYYTGDCRDSLTTYKGDPLTLEFETNYMYNDFQTLEKGHAFRIGIWDDVNTLTDSSVNTYDSENEVCLVICYSGEDECMVCGGSIDPEGAHDIDEFANRLVCDECCPTYYCNCCGSIGDRDSMHEVDDMMLCEYCFENNTFQDFLTGQTHLNDNNSIRIYVSKDINEYSEYNNDISFQTLGWDGDQVENLDDWHKYFNIDKPRKAEVETCWNFTMSYYYVLQEDFTPEGLQHFYEEYWVSDSYFRQESAEEA